MADRTLVQFRSRDASLWQSAVEAEFGQAVAPAAGLGGPATIRRPNNPDKVMQQANALAAVIAEEAPVPPVPPPSPGAAFGDTARFCGGLALRSALARFRGDDDEARRLEAQLTQPGGSCDPRWARVLADFLANRLRDRPIPYRRHTSLDDFVISGNDVLPDNARIAMLGDWGTGQAGAAELLGSIKAKQPDVVVHLGDVYFSGTEREFKNFFYALWQRVLQLPNIPWGQKPNGPTGKPATFALCGNHDVYAGGEPYYKTIDTLGQPASYFCLRNENWQIIALDTGLHDANPVKHEVTFLEDSEVEWLKHKIATAGKRRTILLTHHQLFSAMEKIGDDFVNQPLFDQVKDVLPRVTAWFWGHEHNLIIYGNHLGTLGRCIGHGAFPVGRDEEHAIKATDIPVDKIHLSLDKDGAHFQHGYALLQLNGSDASVDYIEYDELTDTEHRIHGEHL